MEHAEKANNLNVFLPDQVKAVFGSGWLNQNICRDWILKKLHPSGAFCPKCKSELTGGKALRFWQGLAVKCKFCRKAFTARTGTILSGKNLTYQEIIFLSFLLVEGSSDIEISEFLNCNRETIRLWRKNFMTWEKSFKCESGESACV